MTGSAISSIGNIIKVLYNPDKSLKCFLIKESEENYTLYTKRGKGNGYYYSKTFSLRELDQINELFKSPIEKIDRDELERF